MLVAIFVILAICIVGFGALSLSQATAGVGIIAIGCFFGILARLAQASAHHDELKKLIAEPRPAISASAPVVEQTEQFS